MPNVYISVTNKRAVLTTPIVIVNGNSDYLVTFTFDEEWDAYDAKTMEVKGRCLIQGLPKVIELSSKEMLEAMMEPISAIFDAVCSVIEKTPPELVGDVLKNGIVLTGGGSLLYGLDRLMADVIEIKTRVAKEPIKCVALGTGKILQYLDRLPDGVIDLSQLKRQ